MEVLEFMIHSSELAPGTSPLTPSERDAEGVFRCLEELFGDYRDLGVEGCTLSALAGTDQGSGTRDQGKEGPEIPCGPKMEKAAGGQAR